MLFKTGKKSFIINITNDKYTHDFLELFFDIKLYQQEITCARRDFLEFLKYYNITKRYDKKIEVLKLKLTKNDYDMLCATIDDIALACKNDLQARYNTINGYIDSFF